jgi:sulfoxide reductase heme-binding subunit YedZ
MGSTIMVYFFYTLLSAPLWYWTYLGFTDRLGAEPMVTLSVQSGYVTLSLLLINLWLGVGIQTLKARFNILKWWYQRRRSIGIAIGIYAFLHFLTYLGKEGFENKAWEQIVTKIYLTVSFIALCLLSAMALTSNNFSVRRLKMKNWKRLHRTVHFAGILILIHVLLIEKANIPLLLLMTVPIIPFQIWRIIRYILSHRKVAGNL